MMRRTVAVLTVAAVQGAPTDDFEKLKAGVTGSQVFKDKVTASCAKVKQENCADVAQTKLFCALLKRSKPELAAAHCGAPAAPTTAAPAVPAEPAAQEAAPASSAPKLGTALAEVKARIEKSADFKAESEKMSTVLGCNGVKKSADCASYVQEVAFCLSFADQMSKFAKMDGVKEETNYCTHIDDKIPKLSLFLQNTFKKPTPVKFMQVSSHEQRAPEDDLAQEMTHDLEMNFNKIAPFGKEDTAKELQDHAAKTQDTLVDAVENAEVAEIKRAVFRALTRLRAATIKEFDTIARLETQAIDAYNDAHHYRAENPLTHLHEDEAPVETDKLKSFH
jgi:hypothetical protein